jgi:UDPglucose 6-dehydrogenase
MTHRLAIVGSGYVGTVAAACFAHIGHEVVAIETNPARLQSLQSTVAPFYEPGLDALIASSTDNGRLRFTDDCADGMAHSDVVFICVGTPAGPDGHPDLSAVLSAAQSIASALDTHHHIVVNKSTVPIGTGRWIMAVMEETLGRADMQQQVSIVSNPEFLREGRSVRDFLYPDRVVIGSDDEGALAVVGDIYRPLLELDFPDAERSRPPAALLTTTLATAEMIKYASNAFLATKISFANEMARICDMVGADVTEVTRGMGLDPRIGPSFLAAGLGWGGSCFPKDILALIRTASEYNYQPRILAAALEVNDAQRKVVLEALLGHLKTLRGARVGMLGLAFKPGTDDMRDSAGLDVARMLLERGALVVAHDPMVPEIRDIPRVPDFYDVANGADAVVLATEWPEYLSCDLAALASRMRGTLFFDGRNSFDPAAVQAAGLRYVGIGRASLQAFSDRKRVAIGAVG